MKKHKYVALTSVLAILTAAFALFGLMLFTAAFVYRWSQLATVDGARYDLINVEDNLINVITIGIIVHAFYYPKAKRRDYYFTFSIIGVSIFLLIYLMGGVKLKIGFALGLFAIFGIIKYRTEQVPIREMTYMFVIIAVAAINGLATSVSYFELLGTNLIFIIALAICENTKWMKHVPSKLIKYDNVKLVAHGKEDELKADLEKRLCLKIIRIEVGNVDFLKDSAIIKIYYEPIMDEFGTIDSVMKTGKIK